MLVPVSLSASTITRIVETAEEFDNRETDESQWYTIHSDKSTNN